MVLLKQLGHMSNNMVGTKNSNIILVLGNLKGCLIFFFIKREGFINESKFY